MNTVSTIVQKRVPDFLVQREARFRKWGDLLTVLWTRHSPATSPRPSIFRAHLAGSQPHLASPAIFASALLHFAVAFFLVRLPFSFLVADAAQERQSTRKVYELRRINLSAYFPALHPPEPGGRPGRGTRPHEPPARGSTAFDPKLTLISNPPRPDNSRQTIVQVSSPPDVRIPFELRLPNILVSSAGAVPKPPLKFNLDAMPAPGPSRTKTQLESQPLEAPAVPSPLAMALSSPPLLDPHLAVPSPPPPGSSETRESEKTTEIADLGGRSGTSSETGGLLAVSVNPGPFSELLALPPGNRYGSFSISPTSPTGGQPGSLGGVPGGDPQGGIGGAGTGGGGSVGVGAAGAGGGGGGTAGEAILSSTGNGGSEGVGGRRILPSNVALSRVYPVLSTPQLPRMALLITTGPIGGGGLRIYGVLQGGKVYTTVLPMPGKNWILQYCQRKNLSPQRAQKPQSTVAEVDLGLNPPYATQKFDFHRPAISAEKANEMIILHGLILEDGSVGDLKILQGVQAEADQAALAAFGRWKFRPALRSGKPASVEILVGIPATVPPI